MIKANKNNTSLVFIRNIISNKKLGTLIVAQKTFRENGIAKKMKSLNQKSSNVENFISQSKNIHNYEREEPKFWS